MYFTVENFNSIIEVKIIKTRPVGDFKNLSHGPVVCFSKIVFAYLPFSIQRASVFRVSMSAGDVDLQAVESGRAFSQLLIRTVNLNQGYVAIGDEIA